MTMRFAREAMQTLERAIDSEACEFPGDLYARAALDQEEAVDEVGLKCL